MPMTWGWWRTRILLPADAVNWTVENRRMVLLHELAHAKRMDCLTQLLAEFACALHWFNPLAWAAWHQMRAERERACDDLVLQAGMKPSAYAEQLFLIAAETPALPFSAAAIAMARPSGLEQRLAAILEVGRNRTRWGFARVGLAAALMLAVALPLAVLRGED